MGGLEGMLTGVSDELAPILNRYRYGRQALTGLVVFGACLLAVPNITDVCSAISLMIIYIALSY